MHVRKLWMVRGAMKGKKGNAPGRGRREDDEDQEEIAGSDSEVEVAVSSARSPLRLAPARALRGCP
jgi:hypothetical protein